MISLRYVVTLLLFGWLPLYGLPQGVTLKLKPETTVVGPQISAFEICLIEPYSKNLARKLKTIILGRAAPPGEAKDITRNQLKLQLRRAGLKKLIPSITGPRVVRVKTAQRDITRIRIDEAVAGWVGEKMHEREDVEWKIEYKRVPEKVAGPAGDFHLRVKPRGAFKGRGYHLLEVQAVKNGIVCTKVPVAIVIHTYERVLVATKKLTRKQRLRPSWFTTELLETTHIAHAPLKTLPEDRAVQAKVIIPAGKMLTENMIEPVPLVSRGQRVELLISAGAVALRTYALAQEPGNAHEWIRVWALETKRVLRGVVTPRGRVRVEL